MCAIDEALDSAPSSPPNPVWYFIVVPQISFLRFAFYSKKFAYEVPTAVEAKGYWFESRWRFQNTETYYYVIENH